MKETVFDFIIYQIKAFCLISIILVLNVCYSHVKQLDTRT